MARHRERGFALPLTLFVIAIVTIILSTALIEAGVDRRIAESAADQMDVLTIAQSGLQGYLSHVNHDACSRPQRPADGDSTRINLPGGYANVVTRVLRKPTTDSLTPWTYVVRSTGVAITPHLGAAPQARRTVAEFAGWNSGWMEPVAAFVAANGLDRNPAGGTGQLSWQDQAPSCPNAVVPLRVAGGIPDLTGYDLAGGTPVGGGTHPDVAKLTKIDWAATIGTGMIPDYNYVRPWDNNYHSMRVVGNAVLGAPGATTYGYGLLVVTGDLTVVGDFVQWYGVILVGGKIDFTATDQRFDGTVVSGLNAQLGVPVPKGHIGGGYLDIDYDSRYVLLGLTSEAGFGPMTNTWVENWATY